MGVEGSGVGVDGIDDDEATSGFSHSIQRDTKCIGQKSRPMSLMVQRPVEGEARKDNRGNDVRCAPSDCGSQLLATNEVRRQREVGNDHAGFVQPHVRPAAAGSIRMGRVVFQPAIERILPARERAQVVIRPKPFAEEHEALSVA